MAGKNVRREAALNEARQVHRATGQKVSRLRRTGVNTKTVDPRQGMDWEHVSQLGGHELRQYINRGRRFLSRDVQFLPGKDGKPLPKGRVQALVRLQEQHNEQARAYERANANLPVPGVGETVGGWIDRHQSARFNKAKARRAIYESFLSTVGNIDGAAALEKLIKDARKRTFKNYQTKEMEKARASLRQMFDRTGNPEFNEKLDELSDNQLNLVVDYSELLRAAEQRYDDSSSIDTSDPRNQSQAFINNGAIIEEILEGAKTLPKKANFSGNVRSEYTDTNARPVPVQRGVYVEKSPAGPIPVQQPTAVKIGKNSYTPVGDIEGAVVYRRESDGQLGHIGKDKRGRRRFH